MAKVSVLVPVYGVEKYIARCAHSLFQQTLDDIEFIFINDCTQDRSIDILKEVLSEYPNRQPQTIIHNMSQNGGLAAARRQGEMLATGDFFIHCDSDDWVDTDLYEKMYECAISSCVDIVVCPIKDEYENTGKLRTEKVLPCDTKLVLENLYKESVGMFVWNKLVKRSVYSKHQLLSYEGIDMWEDNGLMYRIFYYANGLSQVEGVCYHYNRSNAGAITHGYGIAAVNQMIDCAQRIESFFKTQQDYIRYEKSILALKFLARINLITDSFSGLKEYKRTFPETDQIVPYIAFDSFSTKGRIRFLCVKYHLSCLFISLFKIRNFILRVAI